MMLDNTRDISGRIAGVNLSSFLQMIEMEQDTCTIKIFTKKDLGRIFFLNGILIDADTRSLNQLEALYAILSWQNIVIEVEKNVSRKEDVIRLPLMHILMESARISDEKEDRQGPGDPDETASATLRHIPLQILSNKEFCLEIGIRRLLDFDGLGVTFRSTLVGIEHHELRSHKRFKCSIVAQAGVDGAERGGVIENISKGGCRFSGSEGEAVFMGEVKNASRKSGEIAVGVQFLHLDTMEDVGKIIHDYIQLIEWSSEAV